MRKQTLLAEERKVRAILSEKKKSVVPFFFFFSYFYWNCVLTKICLLNNNLWKQSRFENKIMIVSFGFNTDI